MGFLDKAKQAAEQAKTAAEQAAGKANEAVSDVQTKQELKKAYGEFGEAAFALADSGAITHPDLAQHVTRIRELKSKLDAESSNGAADTPVEEAVEQPLSGADLPTG